MSAHAKTEELSHKYKKKIYVTKKSEQTKTNFLWHSTRSNNAKAGKKSDFWPNAWGIHIRHTWHTVSNKVGKCPLSLNIFLFLISPQSISLKYWNYLRYCCSVIMKKQSMHTFWLFLCGRMAYQKLWNRNNEKYWWNSFEKPKNICHSWAIPETVL